MLKRLFSLFLALFMGVWNFIAICYGVGVAWGPKIDLDKFELTFEDTFDGEQLDSTKWTTKKYWNNDHDYIRQGGFWDPEQITVSDGTLKITTEYKENGKYGPGYYTGMLNTKGLFEQTHGYFEIRCILPKAEGMWSAFWMLCDSMADVTDGGRNGAEIDIYESANYQDWKVRNSVSHAVHVDGYGSDLKSEGQGSTLANRPYDEFNTYGLEWNEEEYIFYVNGRVAARTSFQGTPMVPEFMIISCEVGGSGGVAGDSWAGNMANNKEGTLPAQMTVEYVRAYASK